MKQDRAEIEIQRIQQLLVKRYKPRKIILFGSFAWGKPDKNSDLDLLVIKQVRQPRPLREQKIYSLLMNYLTDRELPVDVIVHTPKETEERLSLGDPFITQILTRGKILYEQS